MSISQSNGAGLALNPLGAGDLIDRSVRFYRKNFWTFILVAAPPVVAGILFSVGWMILGRNLFNVTYADPAEAIFYQLFLRLGDLIIWIIQLVAILVVMGGASRNFVRHLLFGEAMTFRETYRNARSRLVGLSGVSLLLTISLGFLGIVIFYISILVAVLGIGVVVLVLESIPFLAIVISTVLSIAAIGGGIILFFLVASRFIYVPQVMLVEGAGAFSAIGRSVTLAGKNVKRVAALSIFTVVAIYSALSLLYVPLSLFAYFSGVPLFSFDAANTLPAWFEISSQVIFQGSLILIIPVLVIGLCLLYVDERTRREGYDIELLAATHLGDMPSVPPEFVNPLQPALAEEGVIRPVSTRPPVRERPKGPLGLE
ncbi:MAG TPA: hypothetical protein VMM38_04165 [Aridibacter sp.]|nr:hypothetical protein [Aridibacter sp.]